MRPSDTKRTNACRENIPHTITLQDVRSPNCGCWLVRCVGVIQFLTTLVRLGVLSRHTPSSSAAATQQLQGSSLITCHMSLLWLFFFFNLNFTSRRDGHRYNILAFTREEDLHRGLPILTFKASEEISTLHLQLESICKFIAGNHKRKDAVPCSCMSYKHRRRCSSLGCVLRVFVCILAPCGTVDQAISCFKKKKKSPGEGSKCFIIFKSPPLGSVETRDEYREVCRGVYVISAALPAVLRSEGVWSGVCRSVHSRGLWGLLVLLISEQSSPLSRSYTRIRHLKVRNVAFSAFGWVVDSLADIFFFSVQ